MFETNKDFIIKCSVNSALQTGAYLHSPSVLTYAKTNLPAEKVQALKEAKIIASYTDKDEKTQETFLLKDVTGVLKSIKFYTGSEIVKEKGKDTEVFYFDATLEIENEAINGVLKFPISLMAKKINGIVSNSPRLHFFYLLCALESYLIDNGENMPILIETATTKERDKNSDRDFANVSFYVKNGKGKPFYKSERKYKKETSGGLYGREYFESLIQIKTSIETIIEAVLQSKSFDSLGDTEQ